MGIFKYISVLKVIFIKSNTEKTKKVVSLTNGIKKVRKPEHVTK